MSWILQLPGTGVVREMANALMWPNDGFLPVENMKYFFSHLFPGCLKQNIGNMLMFTRKQSLGECLVPETNNSGWSMTHFPSWPKPLVTSQCYLLFAVTLQLPHFSRLPESRRPCPRSFQCSFWLVSWRIDWSQSVRWPKLSDESVLHWMANQSFRHLTQRPKTLG